MPPLKSRSRAALSWLVTLTLLMLLGLPVKHNDVGASACAVDPGLGYSIDLQPSTDHDLSQYRMDIDTLASDGQSWVRVGIKSWDVSGVWGGEMHWDEAKVAKYREAFDYALSKGLNIFMVINSGHDVAGLDFAGYRALMTEYWKGVAARFIQYARVWQIYNEIDATHYRRVGQPVTLTPQYLGEVEQLLSAAGAALHSADPDVLVTTNSSGYPMNDAAEQHWQVFWDAVNGAADAVTVDTYPADNIGEIAQLTGRLNRLEERYDKPVIVAETGLPTNIGGVWDESSQAHFLPLAIQAIRAAGVHSLFVYELRNHTPDRTDSESNFGILYHDRTPKSSAASVVKAMQPDSQDGGACASSPRSLPPTESVPAPLAP